jgi:hypothetical protein
MRRADRAPRGGSDAARRACRSVPDAVTASKWSPGGLPTRSTQQTYRPSRDVRPFFARKFASDDPLLDRVDRELLDLRAIVPPVRSRTALSQAAACVAVLVACSPAHADQPFAPASFWNSPIPAQAPLAANSAGLVAELQRQVAAKGAWINTTDYSVPVYTVPVNQARVRVKLDTGYVPLQRDLASVPLPGNAAPASGGDGHLTVVQPATDTLWDFWQLRKAPDGWHARWGGKMANVSTSPGYFPAPVGATGSGLPLLGGLIRVADLHAGHVDHALAIGIPNVKAGSFAWPAQRTDGNSNHPTAIPEGTRFRLDPLLDVNALGLPPAGRTIALAAQRYGIVVRDIAGAVTLYAEDPAPTHINPYPSLFGNLYPNQVLARFPWSRLQVAALPSSMAPPPSANAVAAIVPAPAIATASAPQPARRDKAQRSARSKPKARHPRRSSRHAKRATKRHAAKRRTSRRTHHASRGR